MNFFNLYKPKKYDYRYIYYDPEKDKKQGRESQAVNAQTGGGEYRPSTLRPGVFREMAARNRNARAAEMRKTNIRLIFIVAALVAIAYFLLK